MNEGHGLEPPAPTPHSSGSSFASRHSRAAAAAAASTSKSTPVLAAPPRGPNITLPSIAAEPRVSPPLPSAVGTSSAGGQPRLDAMVANTLEPALRSSAAPVTTIATDTSNLPNVHEERQLPPFQAAVATSSAAEIEATLPPGVGASTTSFNSTFNRLIDPAGPPPSRVSALTVAALAAQIRPPLTYESALATLLVRELQEAEPLLSMQITNHELSLALLAVPDDGAFRALVQLMLPEQRSLVTKLVRHARRAVAMIARDEAGSQSEPERILQTARRLWAVVQQELRVEQAVAGVLRIVVQHDNIVIQVQMQALCTRSCHTPFQRALSRWTHALRPSSHAGLRTSSKRSSTTRFRVRSIQISWSSSTACPSKCSLAMTGQMSSTSVYAASERFFWIL